MDTVLQPFRRKGMLAFLEDSVTLFPHDADACKKITACPPRRRRRRRRRRRQRRRGRTSERKDRDTLPGETIPSSSSSSMRTTTTTTNTTMCVTTTLTEIMTNKPPRVVLLFFYDPEQIYSIKVRNRILQLMSWSKQQQQSRDDDDHKESSPSSSSILCCAMIVGKNGTRELSSSDYDFLASTGMIVTRVASTMALQNIFLPRVQGLPHVMPISVDRGQVLGGAHEDIALEWNHPQHVHGRWMEERSGLDCYQQVLSGVLFPTACTIL